MIVLSLINCNKQQCTVLLGGVRSPIADLAGLTCNAVLHSTLLSICYHLLRLPSQPTIFLSLLSDYFCLRVLHVAHVAMAANPDSLNTAPTGEPALPFDPPGSVRMTKELHLRYSDDRRPRVNQYLRSHRVGKGQHGEVWVCWDLSNNRREVVSPSYPSLALHYFNTASQHLSGNKGRET